MRRGHGILIYLAAVTIISCIDPSIYPIPSPSPTEGTSLTPSIPPTPSNTPGTDTPGTDTPGTDTPGTASPGTDTPGTDTPGTDTPGTDTPGTNTPTPSGTPPITATPGAQDEDGDGYSPVDGDCDESDINVNPGESESCNGVDDNCDDSIDEGLSQVTYFADTDEDGFGDSDQPQTACTAPSGFVSDATDCDDSNPLRNPDAPEQCNDQDDDCDSSIDESVQVQTWYQDADLDGFGAPSNPVEDCARPGEIYVLISGDCNDSNGDIHPEATESCNTLDDNCNSQTDEGVQSTFYRDSDQDGFGDSAVTSAACSVPSGYVTNATDCNDQNALMYPGANEICDSLDNDCDLSVDEGMLKTFYYDGDGDGYGGSTTTQACSAYSNYVGNTLDCNDGAVSINPGASEVCDGVDNNCSGQTDEGVKTTYYADTDKDGFGTPTSTTQACTQPTGFSANSGDCNDNYNTINPGATEICDFIDNDCDGSVDEGFPHLYAYVDSDQDGYGTGSLQGPFCAYVNGYAVSAGDCNDSNNAIYPGATEVCDSKDNDCDGSSDEGLPQGYYYLDSDQDGYGTGSLQGPFCMQSSGYSVTGGDCNDGDTRVHPGGGAYTTPSSSGWDYNCDGVVSKAINTLVGSCTCSGQYGATYSPGWEGSVPDCGVAGTYHSYDATPGCPTACTDRISTQIQACY